MLTQKKSLLKHVLRKACSLLGTVPNREFQFHVEDSYPMPQPRTDLKRMTPPEKDKVYDACWQTTRRTEYKCRSDIEFNVPAFIDARKGCLQDCALEMDAADLAHYKPHDMLKRVYQRTWYECVIKKPRRKAFCVHKPPPLPRRKRKAHKNSTCQKPPFALGRVKLGLKKCGKKDVMECPRFCMPNCKEARNPPKCRRPFRGGLCTRRKCKYPSFSECRHDPIPDAPPIECKCLARPAICDMWRFYRRKSGITL
ncbi:uncharacterized protein Dana_GF14894 [Drosophila ananassae]|uniref:Uncharacterized protein n=1 Tax=Drosophila ananassae TaxID=7217 RepID=B3MLE5_DROAN|nr:uncharacterized protein LOC6497709 [Drosophila ananassae]EDV30734.1 uncharacterized protein Dana_GF14894 [Drosophila ananassae]